MLDESDEVGCQAQIIRQLLHRGLILSLVDVVKDQLKVGLLVRSPRLH